MTKSKKSCQITKLVLPVAGFGKRFLPQTKYLAKEMFPILNTPIMHYLVSEAISAGIKEIIVVLSHVKNSIVEYFSNNYNTWKNVKIHLVYQEKQLGLGHAIKCAESYCNKEPFAVLLGDDIYCPKKNEDSPLKECIDAFKKCKCTVIGVQKVVDEHVNKYGIVDFGKKISKNLYRVKNVVEKPQIGKNPSNYAILGRYVFTPDIFKELNKTKADKTHEIQITSAIEKQVKKNKVCAQIFKGTRFDTGYALGYVKALTYTALHTSDVKDEYISFLQETLKKYR